MSDSLATQLEAAAAALAVVPTDVASFTSLTDASLLDLTRLSARVQRAASTTAALIAGEVARRSAPELGHAGLAQAAGYRTPEHLIRVTTGSTARDAATAVHVGKLAHDAAAPAPQQPWLAPVGAALVADELSVAAAESITNGLGSPSTAVGAAELAAAAIQLCAEAPSLDADLLYRRARELRDELDAAGITDRETERREQRALRFHRRPDGVARLTWDMDPETAALVGETYDRATSPRRGGPRFVDPETVHLADRIANDTRTTEQLASDTFAELLRQGAAADSSQLLGSGAPSIRVLVTDSAFRSRTGHGRIEGQPDPISIETIERLACEGVLTEVIFDGSSALDVGREHRLYTRKQRVALAARDGGCMFGDCDRPPSWCEAHHVNHWVRDNGRTDVDDGILMCRHHHMLLHNNSWEIERRGNEYWLIPPPEIDPEQKPILLASKSRALKDLLRESA